MEYFEKIERILLKEMNLALGCTEPIAIALSSAKAVSYFGKNNIKVVNVYCSGSVLKNAHSVKVPNAKERCGIKYASALGISGGKSEYNLEVLKNINDEDIVFADKLVEENKILVNYAENVDNLFVQTSIEYLDGKKVSVVISSMHDHISLIKINDEVIFEDKLGVSDKFDYSILSIQNIYEFVNKIDFNKYRLIDEKIQKSIEVNVKIAEEGIKNQWGLNVGKSIQKLCNNDDIFSNAKALAAAGSDARMSGCSLPVMINSGSGNQGITLSIPVIYYSKRKNIDNDKLKRALLFSNLISIHQKQHIGKLSAFCGVVCSAASAACGIGYIQGLNYNQIEMIIINTLVSCGGMFCDGATPSCALKISTALDCAFTSLELASNNMVFKSNEGIVGINAETTIDNIGILASKEMKNVDDCILKTISK